MNVVGRGTTHDRTNALLHGLDVDDVSFDEDEEKVCRIRRLSPTLDDALIGIDDLIEFPSSPQASSSSFNSLPSLLKKQRTAETNSGKKTAQIKQNLSANFCDELPCNSGYVALSERFTIPESRQNKRSQLCVKRNIGEDSDDDITMISRPVARSSQNESSSNTELHSSIRNSRGNLAIDSSLRECEISSSSSSFYTPSNIRNQIFIKIMIKKDDGTHLKTKGMPFASSCIIGDIRKRCEEELRGDVEYKSMTIYYNDCELSDDTPVELVLADEKILECIISGWSKPTAAQIYAKRTRKLMANVLHAFAESTNGSLDLREMNIGQDDAVCAAVELIGDYSIYDALNKLDLSHNNLNDDGPDYLVIFISLCPNLADLKLASCNISRNIANDLVQQIKKISSLEVLDLSFNLEINSDHASEIIQACKNLKCLDLSCTAVSRIDNMPEVERKLETLKLSLNDLHNPDYIIQWSLSYCQNMLFLDLSATTATCSIIEICLKIKVDKMPFTTVLLANCSCLEMNPEAIADTLKASLITSSTIRFQFGNRFRRKIEELLPDSYKFCLK
ncbi:Leucine Rich Repeat family protein [Dirofilaria immitis]|nr:Leucine Rich Repeat family protein [Dirofilaria immitis]